MLSNCFNQLARRATLIAGIVAVASAVACSDESTAPRPANVAIPTTGAEATILPARTTVSVHIRSIWGTLLPEKAAVKFFAANDSGIIFDNSAADKDPVVGSIKVSLAWSSTFKACLVYDTKTYAIDVTKPYCNSAAGNKSAVDLASLTMRQFPAVGAYMRDMNDNPITGGTIKFTAPPSDGFTATVTDGGAGDGSPAVDGMISVRGNRPGTYTWCETAPPTGYKLASPVCGTVELYWDMGTGFTIQHQKSGRL